MLQNHVTKLHIIHGLIFYAFLNICIHRNERRIRIRHVRPSSVCPRDRFLQPPNRSEPTLEICSLCPGDRADLISFKTFPSFLVTGTACSIAQGSQFDFCLHQPTFCQIAHLLMQIYQPPVASVYFIYSTLVDKIFCRRDVWDKSSQ